MDNYDEWLTSPPTHKRVKRCRQCNNWLETNEEVYYDGDNYFCDYKCLKKYVIKHIDTYLDEFIGSSIYKITLDEDDIDEN